MPQSIPSGLNRDHVLQALADLEAGVDHPFGQPTGYELVHEGKHYPPKAVIGLACKYSMGRVLMPEEFSGGFLRGARAQEEYLARSSCLYECIRSNPMYEFHRLNDDPLYSDYAIYSPGVPVIRDDNHSLLEQPYTISMITSPAAYAKGLVPHRRAEIAPAMWHRILKVLALGIEHGHDGIVLGAWGCGAFGNDGHEIAQLFHKALSENFKGAYRRVIFAIVDWSEDRKFIGPFEAQFRV